MHSLNVQAKPVQDASSDVTGNSNDDALQGRRRHNSDDDQIIRNSPEVQYKSFRNVKLPRFNGEQPGEFEVFLLQFETYATNMGLADRERMNAMRMALYGQAAKMILRYNHLSYGEFVAELKKSYGAENQEEYYRAKLMTYKRKPEEEISQLKLQLENIATHAFPGECNSKLYREALRDAFMDSLSGYPELQTEVWRCKPATIGEAALEASQIEVLMSRNRLPGKDGSTQYVKSSTGKGMRACGTSNNCSETEVSRSEMESMMKKLVLDMQNQLSAQMNANVNATINAAVSKLQNVPVKQNAKYAGVTKPVSQSTTDMNCFNCKKDGHWRVDCPELTDEDRAKWRKKWQKGKKVKQGGPNSADACTNANSTVPHVSCVIYGNGRRCYFTIFIDNKPHKVLADTGCAPSCIPTRLVPAGVLIEPVTEQAVAANATPIQFTGKVKLKFKLEMDGPEYEQEMFTCDSMCEIIFGLEWLDEMTLQWNAGKGNLMLNGTQVQLLLHQNGVYACRVYMLNAVQHADGQDVSDSQISGHQENGLADEFISATEMGC